MTTKSIPICRHKKSFIMRPPYYLECPICEELFVIMPVSVLKELGIDLLQDKLKDKNNEKRSDE